MSVCLNLVFHDLFYVAFGDDIKITYLKDDETVSFSFPGELQVKIASVFLSSLTVFANELVRECYISNNLLQHCLACPTVCCLWLPWLLAARKMGEETKFLAVSFCLNLK